MTRTAAPSDLTPEEEALRNALQKESTREPPIREGITVQNGARIFKHNAPLSRIGRIQQRPIEIMRQPSIRDRGRTKFSEVAPVSPDMTGQNGRLPNYAPAEAPQAAAIVESEEKIGGPQTSESKPVIPPSSPPLKPPISQRPRFGGGAEGGLTTELIPEESRAKPAFRRGDWYCPSCVRHNVWRDEECPSCQRRRPYMDRWQCDECKSTYPPNQQQCNRCRNPIPSTIAQEQENTSDVDLSDHRQTRDAQLDHHISQSRAKPVFRRGDWYCPSCAQHNLWRDGKCPSCQRKKPHMDRWQCDECGSSHLPNQQQCSRRRNRTPSTIAQEQTKYAQHWKHVRRAGFDGSPERSQPEHSLTQRHSEDTQAIAKARAIEQETTERLERTKGGKFVGLRGQYESATSKAMKLSHWSLESDTSQVSEVEPTTASTPDTSTTGSNFVTRRRFNQADGSAQPSSFELEREQNARTSESSTREREKRTRREPQEQDIARHAIYQDRPMPYARGHDRDRLRKSKKVVSAYDDVDEEGEGRAARRMERKDQRKKARATQKATAAATPIYLPEFISVSNLAGVLKVRVEDFIYKMQDLGFEEVNYNHVLDAETAGLVAAEFNFEPIVEQAENQDLLPRPPAQDKSVLPLRPPVVTIMGHVDHGKTTLLDYLRKSSVAASEHGGITQHIGAFSVPMPGGRLVTFLDTPGHEAFLSMRQRGANVTDIVILVVAADDSVKPQTIEAIRHAQAAKVPMIVAVNKIDKEDSNVERVKQDLARYSVEIEDYGGDTQVVCVSGKTGQGMEELEDAAVALADILDVRSETDGLVEGWVLEATTRKAGRVATVLVRRGTLRTGDIVVAGTSWARVRSLRNEAGVMLNSVGPGTPVEIDGWREQPTAGDEVLQAPDEQRAKAVVDYRLEAYGRTQMATDVTAINEARRLEQEKREELERAADLAEANPLAATTSTDRQSTPLTPSFQEVFFIVKADVSGSAEAVTDAVSALGNSEIRPHILRTGVGPVTEFDIDHAAVAEGHIISFNTTVEGSIQRMAEAKGVKILDQSIIYRLVDDVKANLSEKLPAIVTQKVLGEAEIAQVFEINPKGRIKVPVAGCRIRNGVIGRNHKIRVLRDKEVVYDGMLLHDPCCHNKCADLMLGTLASLKNVKKDVTEMRKGNECGMGFENWTEFKLGDQVQSYEEMSEKRFL